VTLRTWINCWWTDDPDVHPCPKCGCPLQAPPRRSVAATIAEHYSVVHPGDPVAVVPAGGVS
jgi:hypothetical protein